MCFHDSVGLPVCIQSITRFLISAGSALGNGEMSESHRLPIVAQFLHEKHFQRANIGNINDVWDLTLDD